MRSRRTVRRPSTNRSANRRPRPPRSSGRNAVTCHYCSFTPSLPGGDLRRAMDRPANPRIGPAPAQVAAHRVVDVGVGRIRFLRQQAGRRHHLPRLAIAALRDLYFQPRLLYWVAQVAREPFDRGHDLPFGARHRSDAGTDRVAVEINRAATAESHAATIFRAGQPEVFAQNPQQRLFRLGLNRDQLAVDSEDNLFHGCFPSIFSDHEMSSFLPAYFGHAQPFSTHSLIFWTNSAWLRAGALRPSPGFHPHNTSGSWLM